jgi:hypothetical protein
MLSLPQYSHVMGEHSPQTHFCGRYADCCVESLKRIVVVSFGMSAEFLAALAGEGRTVVTVLRTD